MPRYALLEHDWPFPHLDLMLERCESEAGLLRTWRLPFVCSLLPPLSFVAELLADHRRDFLTFEGPLTGERGRVTRRDHGEFAYHSDTADHIELTFRSESGPQRTDILLGRYELLRQNGTLWLFHSVAGPFPGNF